MLSDLHKDAVLWMRRAFRLAEAVLAVLDRFGRSWDT